LAGAATGADVDGGMSVSAVAEFTLPHAVLLLEAGAVLSPFVVAAAAAVGFVEVADEVAEPPEAFLWLFEPDLLPSSSSLSFASF